MLTRIDAAFDSKALPLSRRSWSGCPSRSRMLGGHLAQFERLVRDFRVQDMVA